MIKIKLIKTTHVDGELRKAGEVLEVSNNVAHGLLERKEATLYKPRKQPDRMMRSKTYQIR